MACSPINDSVDSYWHVRIGREILATHRLHDLGMGWLDVPPPGHWLTSEWLGEVTIAGLVNAFGWRSLVVARVVLMALAVALLVPAVLRRRPALIAVPIFLVSLVEVYCLGQDRPELVPMVLLPLVGWAAVRLLAGAGRPPLLLVAGLALVCAQFHGLWILGPAAFLLVAAGLALERRPWLQVRAALLTAAAGCAGVVNPWGPESFWLPLRFHASGTAQIGEWAPTSLVVWFPASGLLLGVVCVAAWLRCARTAPDRPLPWAEVLWVAAWTLYALLAIRNVAPAVLLIAPVTAAAATRAWGGAVGRIEGRTSVRESWVLAAAAGLVLVVGLSADGLKLSRVDPLADTPALRIAQWFAAQPAPLRVVNAYNASGALIQFGGGNALVDLDGRADLWGANGIADATSIEVLGAGWQQRFARIDPQALVLYKDAPLETLLLDRHTWRVTITDGEYVLMLPVPGAAGRS